MKASSGQCMVGLLWLALGMELEGVVLLLVGGQFGHDNCGGVVGAGLL